MANSWSYKIAERVVELLAIAADGAHLQCGVYLAQPDAVKIDSEFDQWINVMPRQIGILSNMEPSSFGMIQHGMVLGIELCVRASYDVYWREADALWTVVHPVMHSQLEADLPNVVVNVTYRGMSNIQVDDSGERVQMCVTPDYLIHFRTAENAVDLPFA